VGGKVEEKGGAAQSESATGERGVQGGKGGGTVGSQSSVLALPALSSGTNMELASPDSRKRVLGRRGGEQDQLLATPEQQLCLPTEEQGEQEGEQEGRVQGESAARARRNTRQKTREGRQAWDTG
jgi:hypothetical protein